MIHIDVADRILNFNARMGSESRAREQLEGAVALHNLLQKNGVAYLADEVGMGKTYVALGAMALFRHFHPGFRVLIIAPRENIQRKWMKELRNFVTFNVRYADLRMKGLDGGPARPLVMCGNLMELVREATVNPNRDFFARMTSFSFGLPAGESVDPDAARKVRDSLRSQLPWLPNEIFDLRSKQMFRGNLAKAICCALPIFDLVIIDEAHALKHGLSSNVALRNTMLNLALGFSPAPVDGALFPHYGPRARRVLLLSATPIEETYRHLYNQLEVFGRSKQLAELRQEDLEEEHKKRVAAKILIRRVTAIRIGDDEYTKNLYRREWRSGGVRTHDDPVLVDDDRQRLIVALVQKKVSELISDTRFGSSFQVGMLASFESFLETTKVRRKDDETGTFDDSTQTDDALEKDGVDVGEINRLAGSYRRRFGTELPHPKMDALVEALAPAWRVGRKGLVFVRRVASVRELRRRLGDLYDLWLFDRLRADLPKSLGPRIEGIFFQYKEEKRHRPDSSHATATGEEDEAADTGGTDTFFAWFFRGEGPRGIVSGANLQQRLAARSGTYATFFERNYVAELLACRPGDVLSTVARSLQMELSVARDAIRREARVFLSRVKKVARADQFEAAQAAALKLLKDAEGPWQEMARVIWHERFEATIRPRHLDEAPDVAAMLEVPTFFTELRTYPDLCESLWPTPSQADPRSRFRESELRAQLLRSAARLGHALIDLYILTIRRIGSLEARAQEDADDSGESLDALRVNEYLELLDRQRTGSSDEEWGAFDELAEIASNFDLILDVNAPDARTAPLIESARAFGQLLRQQQPIAGMSGQINQTVIRQFRMPGYPLVLISTDLLQEGEDLHTFCSSVYHYGLSWTPSAVEQRIGRVDRVRSQTDRRLGGRTSAPTGSEKLQVYFPYLEDTVEVLQVQRVLERMNTFLRLMHQGLSTASQSVGRIHTATEFNRGRRSVEQIRERLHSAFPVQQEHLIGPVHLPAVDEATSRFAFERFAALRGTTFADLPIEWEPQGALRSILLGTVALGARRQPFALLLKSLDDRLLLRGISPVGCIGPEDRMDAVLESSIGKRARIAAIFTGEERTYDLTVEDEVLLAATAESDIPRLGALLRRIVAHADCLEQEHLPGREEALTAFRRDLEREGYDG